jgi:hypothetical protein
VFTASRPGVNRIFHLIFTSTLFCTPSLPCDFLRCDRLNRSSNRLQRDAVPEDHRQVILLCCPPPKRAKHVLQTISPTWPALIENGPAAAPGAEMRGDGDLLRPSIPTVKL